MLHCLRGWCLVVRCLTVKVKPHPDRSLVTELSVYTTLSHTLLFSATRSLALHSTSTTFPKLSDRKVRQTGRTELGAFPNQ